MPEHILPEKEAHKQKLSMKEKFINEIKKPPYYSFIMLIIAILFSLLTIVVSGFNFNRNLFILIGCISAFVFIYWCIEFILKQTRFGVDILNALFFCLILASLVLGVDTFWIQKKNTPGSFISLESAKEQKTTESIELIPNVDDVININISKKGGNLELKTTGGQEINVTSQYYYSDELPSLYLIKDPGTATFNFRVSPHHLGLSRLINGSNNAYSIQVPGYNNALNLRLQSLTGHNEISLLDSPLTFSEIYLNDGMTNLDLRGSNIIAFPDAVIKHSIVTIKDPESVESNLTAQIDSSNLNLDLSKTNFFKHIEITIYLEDSNCELNLPENLGVKIDYKNYGQLLYEGKSLEDKKGVYTSPDFEKATSSVILKFEIDSKSRVSVTKNVHSD